MGMYLAYAWTSVFQTEKNTMMNMFHQKEVRMQKISAGILREITTAPGVIFSSCRDRDGQKCLALEILSFAFFLKVD